MHSKSIFAIILILIFSLSCETMKGNHNNENNSATDHIGSNIDGSGQSSGIKFKDFKGLKYTETNGIGTAKWNDDSIKAVGPSKNNIKNGFWTLYYPGKKIKFAEGQYKDSKLQGNWKFYYKTGKMMASANYYSGVLYGRYFLYRSNGIPLKIVYYKNGKKHGRESIFLPNGNPKQISSYRDGFRNGQINVYNKSGKRIIIGNYKNDKKHGKWLYLTTEHKWIKTGYYSNDKKVGTWSYYNEKGLLDKKVNYGY